MLFLQGAGVENSKEIKALEGVAHFSERLRERKEIRRQSTVREDTESKTDK